MFDVVDPYWVLSVRADFLTHFFKIFPFFASEYFYIAVVATGFWLKNSKRLFVSLACLVPFATLINCLLKNVFRIPRPDSALHLISVQDPFGFPSGDVQVSTVFWLSFLLVTQDKWLRTLFCLPVVLIALSRVYLGVHSVYDVIGGFFVGWLILVFWQKYFIDFVKKPNAQDCSIELDASYMGEVEAKYFETVFSKYWLLCFILGGLYAAASHGITWPPMVPMAMGAMVGYGLARPWIVDYVCKPPCKIQMKDLVHVVIWFGLLILMAKILPVVKVHEWTILVSLFVKYLILVFSILVVLPRLKLSW